MKWNCWLGEVLTYGEYAIQYWAFDAANNTAHCSFRVAVTRKFLWKFCYALNAVYCVW